MRTVASTTSTSASSTDPAAATSPSRARTPGLVIPGPAFFMYSVHRTVPRSRSDGQAFPRPDAQRAAGQPDCPAAGTAGAGRRSHAGHRSTRPAAAHRQPDADSRASHRAARQGSGITVRADTALHAEGEAAQRVATQFTDLLARSGGPRLTPAKGKTAAAPGGIRFQIVPTFRDSGESYTLESTAQGVVIRPATKPACSTAQPRLPSWPRAEATACCPRYRSGRAALQLARFHARLGTAFPEHGRDQARARCDGRAQAQYLPLAPDR